MALNRSHQPFTSTPQEHAALTLRPVVCLLASVAILVAAAIPVLGASFEDTDIVDLSIYQTSSKVQAPLGTCTTFSMIGAIEAAYTRTYCTNPDSAFSRDGYCERYRFLKAAALAPFALANMPGFADDKGQLDLSELYYVHRVLTAWMTEPGHDHISGNTIDMMHGIERPLLGNAQLIVNNLRLPEESQVPYINSVELHNYLQARFADGFSQHDVDALEFAEAQLRFKDSSGAQVIRPYVSWQGRQNARFGVVGVTIKEDLPDLITYLEQELYAGREVAVDGAVPGHSMLLIGYDREQQRFFFKDHSHSFRFVDYSDILDQETAITTTVVTAPLAYPANASFEEMWLGAWKLDEKDGHQGTLVLRNVRTPPNALLTNDDVPGSHLQQSDTTVWTRVGTFFDHGDDTERRVVYGRLNKSDGRRLELYVDSKRRDNYSADPHDTVAAGYVLDGSTWADQITLSADFQNGRMIGRGQSNAGRSVEITPRTSSQVFDSRAIEARNLLSGHFNPGSRGDIAVWKKNWFSVPTYFGTSTGGFNVTNYNVAENRINEHNNKIVGDFDGDGLDDIVLRKTNTWGKTPAYYSLGNGKFEVALIKNPSGEPNSINTNARTIVGDFNGDGRTDILLWNRGWNVVRTYFFFWRGVNVCVEKAIPSGSNWINDETSRKLVGDFDNDGDDDIALWNPGWSFTPVYFSNGDGSFTVTNIEHAAHENWINDIESRKIVGDFDGDGLCDIALARWGWRSTPVYFSNGDGSFTVTNIDHPLYKTWINDPHAGHLIGDFNGDGRTDVSVWKTGWNSTPVYLSTGSGGFSIYNVDHPQGKNWINSDDTVKIVGDFNGDGRSDVALRVPGASGTPVYAASQNPGRFDITNIPHAPGDDFINQ